MAKATKKETVLTPEEKLKQALVVNMEYPYYLPKNWRWIKWGTVGTFIAGNTFKNEYQGMTEYSIPFYKVGSLKFTDSKGFIFDDTNTISEEIRNELKATLIPSYSILFAKIGEAIRLNRRSINAIPCCIDNNMMAFLPKCLTKYAYYWSCSIDLYGYTNATTVPSIRKSDLELIPFPLSPLPEQERIVDRIESLFAKLDEAKEKAQAVVDGFEDRKAAILHKAFTGELTDNWRAEKGIQLSSWETKTSSDLFVYVTSGSRGWSQFYSDDGAIFVRMGNLDHGTIEIDFSDIQHVNLPDKAEGQRSLIQKDDILISITADVGMIGLVRDVNYEGYINQHIALARPTDKDCAEFIAWYLVSDIGYNQLKNKQRGATKVGLGLDDIKALTLSMPCKQEQEEIVKIITNLLDKDEEAKQAADQVMSTIDTMKKSILARAFRGELGTNDPNDESAEILIKKLQMETIISTKERKTRATKNKKGKVNQLKKSILEVISQQKKISPEELKTNTGLDIDEFYLELKALIDGGKVKETRDGLNAFLEENNENR